MSARMPEVMNETMEEKDKETRLCKRREMQRNNLKLKLEQLKYHKLFSSQLNNNSSKNRKYHFGMVIRIYGNDKVVLSCILPFVK